MPLFELHVVNSDFTSSQDIEADDVEQAMKRGLKAALQIGSDELCKGKKFFGAEVSVEEEGECMGRLMIGLGQSPLSRA